jgi:hypothetical protein
MVLFSNQKSQFGSILEDLAMEGVGIFYDHLSYFTAIWCMFWPFHTIYGHLVYFSRFGMLYQEKSGNPEMPVILVNKVVDPKRIIGKNGGSRGR